ncbi:MAG: sigma-70 family RNA polymerase sigma factor [Planctomycetes bacterium]|nr:sigma-70 family RNA polymerase sigma factor [Planctomycetota bacterium]
MANYKIPAIRDLRDQLFFAPERARKQQVARLEILVREIDPDRDYPYDYLVFRITRFRPERNTRANLAGEALHSDLARLLLDLSGSVNIPVSDAGEQVLSVEELARRYDVSTRTIVRWQSAGLVGEKFIFPDAQKKTGFRQSFIDRYVKDRPGAVAKSRAFSRLTKAEKRQIVRRARNLAERGDLSLSRVARRLAREFGRSRETIRYTLRQFDRRHPGKAVFDRPQRGLTEGDKQTIKDLYDKGTPVRSIGKNFRRTESAIYAIINRMQARDLQAETIEYIYNPEFDEPDADENILGGDIETALQKRSARPSAERAAAAPLCLRHLRRSRLLSKEEEIALFKRYNYIKHKINKLRSALDLKNPSGARLREILDLKNRAAELKDRLIHANLRLVVSVAKRHTGPLTSIAQLISDGNITLMRAVEKFDYGRGNRFSTYASWALMKNFAKTVPEENYHLNKFMTGRQETLEAIGSEMPEPFELAEDPAKVLKEKVLAVLHMLPERERVILRARFALGGGDTPQTLQKIGEAMGLTRERVRQLEARGLKHLRAILEPEAPEPQKV